MQHHGRHVSPRQTGAHRQPAKAFAFSRPCRPSLRSSCFSSFSGDRPPWVGLILRGGTVILLMIFFLRTVMIKWLALESDGLAFESHFHLRDLCNFLPLSSPLFPHLKNVKMKLGQLNSMQGRKCSASAWHTASH